MANHSHTHKKQADIVCGFVPALQIYMLQSTTLTIIKNNHFQDRKKIPDKISQFQFKIIFGVLNS